MDRTCCASKEWARHDGTSECFPGWLTTAAVHHTRLILLAEDGWPIAAAALAYGDNLAQAPWRQRQQTLHTATTMKSDDRLRGEREVVARIDAMARLYLLDGRVR